MKESETGILLNRIAYSETSLILTFYTQSSGIQKYIFQGGKKKAAFLSPLAVCEMQTYGRPDSDLKKISQLEIALVCHGIQGNPLRSAVAFFMAEVLAKCLRASQQDASLFQFLVTQIQLLDESTRLSAFPLQFLLGLSHHLGIEPQLASENPQFFDLEEGEIGSFLNRQHACYSGEAVALLVALLTETEVDSTKAQRREAFEIMLRYYSMHLPSFGKLKTTEVIEETLYN